MNEDAARQIADRLQGTGDNEIRNKNGYVITIVRRIEAASNVDATVVLL